MLVHISRHETSNSPASVAAGALGKIKTQIRVYDGPLRTVISTSHTAAESFVHKTCCLDGDQISWDLLPAWAVTARWAVSRSFKSACVDLEIYLSSLKVVLGVLVILMWCLQFLVFMLIWFCACGLTKALSVCCVGKGGGGVCMILCVCHVWASLLDMICSGQCGEMVPSSRWPELEHCDPTYWWTVVFHWRFWCVWYQQSN